MVAHVQGRVAFTTVRKTGMQGHGAWRLAGQLGAGLLLFATLSAGAAQVPAERLPAVTVPRLSQPPVIDGRIDPAEWREAAAVSGVAAQNPGTKLLVMRPTTYYLAWDADNIYLACRTWIMPGYKPSVGGRAPGSANAFDDGMEFNLKPMGKNVAEGRADSTYKFFITCFGSDGDLARVSVGQMFRNWQPKFTTAFRLTDPGTAPLGGRWWECEAIMPAKEFELNGPNRAGDTWRMLLAFNHIPGWMQAAIPINSAYFDASGWPLFTLGENVPGVQMTMDDMPGALDGVAAAKIRVFNPTAQPVTVTALAQFLDLQKPEPAPELVAGAKDLAKKEQALTVAPGQSAELAINEKFAADLGKNAGGIWLRVAAGERELSRYFTYFKVGYDARWTKAVPRTEAFPLSGTFNPARNNFQLRADTYYLDKPEAAKALRYTVTRQGDAKPVVSGALDKTAYFFFTELVQMPVLKDGDYTVEATMDLADGKTLGPVRTTFKKLDEAKAFAPWWQNKIGDTERVIPPFTAIRSEGDAREVLGRTYHVNQVGLPAVVEARSGPVLAASARLVVVVDGREHRVQGKRATFTEDKPWRSTFRGQDSAAGLTFSVEGTLEQDGLVTVRLTYGPEGKAPVKIDSMRFEFPLAEADAECLLCIGPGGNFSTLNHLVLPKDKYGRLWSTLEMGKGGSMMQVGTFYPNVWIGNERRGILWWADSDEGWVQDDAVPAHEVLREKLSGVSVQVSGTEARNVKPGGSPDTRNLTPDTSCVILRNNLVAKPITLDGPRTLTFSYNATPFKPLPKGWRMALHSEDGTFTGPHKVRKDPKTGKEINGWNWLNPPSFDPTEWSALWAEYKTLADAAVHAVQPFNPAKARNHQSGARQVHTSIPLSGYGAQTSDAAVTSYFTPEWGAGNYNPTMRDLLVWLGYRSVTEGGLRTLYWDIFYTTLYADLQAGFGYRLPDGRVQPTSHGNNLRRHMQRMYSMFQENGLTPGAQVAHSTNAYPLIAFPWMDAVLDGEWAEITDATDRDWVDFYPTDRMRVMSIAENFGVQVSWMGLFHIKDPVRLARVNRGFIDYQRLHDTWTGQDGRFPPDSILEWGLNDARLEYEPYWRNTAVTSPDKDLLVSTWRLKDRVLLMVFNYNRTQTKDATLKVDPKAFGWPAAVGVARELGACGDPGVTFDAATGALTVPGLLPHTARYIGIRNHDPAALERFVQSLAAAGNTSPALPEALLDYGLVSPATKAFTWGTFAQVKPTDAAVQVAAWQLPDRILLALKNAGAATADAVLTVDLDTLGLVPQLPWQEFIRVRDFAESAKPPPASVLDFYGRKLTIPKMAPAEVRWVALRRY